VPPPGVESIFEQKSFEAGSDGKVGPKMGNQEANIMKYILSERRPLAVCWAGSDNSDAILAFHGLPFGC